MLRRHCQPCGCPWPAALRNVSLGLSSQWLHVSSGVQFSVCSFQFVPTCQNKDIWTEPPLHPALIDGGRNVRRACFDEISNIVHLLSVILPVLHKPAKRPLKLAQSHGLFSHASTQQSDDGHPQPMQGTPTTRRHPGPAHDSQIRTTCYMRLAACDRPH